MWVAADIDALNPASWLQNISPGKRTGSGERVARAQRNATPRETRGGGGGEVGGRGGGGRNDLREKEGRNRTTQRN